jgi:hypothetical protein
MSGEFDDDKLWNYYGPKKVRPPEQDPVPFSSPQEGDAASQNEVPGSERAPWKRSKGHRPFVGDVAIVEMRNKALAPNRLSEPPTSPPGKKYRVAVSLAGATMLMAAGIAGYKLGSGPSALLPQSAPRPSQFDQSRLTSEELVPSARPALPSHADPEQLRVGTAQPRQPDEPAKLTVSAADAAGVGNSAPALANAPPTNSQQRRLPASKAALMVKTGSEYMALGSVGAARMAFQSAVEAEDPVAAFALAETYDPLVLKTLNAEGGITPDIRLAHTWYQKAKDLGSSLAPERLDRLAHVSK